MDGSEEREICYMKCDIKSGYLKFEWSIITPSKWDWIGFHRETLTDGRYSFIGTHWIGTVSGQNQISQNREKLLETLQEFTNRNENNVNVYLGTYKNQSAYFVIDHTSYQCLIVYRGGEKDYFLCSGCYGEKVYYKGAEFFSLAESYIPLSFEGRDEITPEDNYELDLKKREKAGTILGELEEITL
ncbi:unnamed protein product [Rhizophagus irregularis]|nr:unnamed protein product [Rhizophagus irregularis]